MEYETYKEISFRLTFEEAKEIKPLFKKAYMKPDSDKQAIVVNEILSIYEKEGI